MLILVEPSLTYKDACLDAVREFLAAGEYDVNAEQLGAKFEDLITRLIAAKDPANMPPGELPYEDFWLMDGDEWIGKLTLRTTINERYLHAGGHVMLAMKFAHRNDAAVMAQSCYAWDWKSHVNVVYTRSS